MQPGRARTTDLGVRPLLLDRWDSWVAPVRPNNRAWFVAFRPSAALGAHVCAVWTAPRRFFTGVRAWFVLCVACAVSLGTWIVFTGVLARCVVLRVQFPGPPGSC